MLPMLNINGQLEPPKTSNIHCVRKQIRRPFYTKELSTTLTAGFGFFLSEISRRVVNCTMFKTLFLIKRSELRSSVPPCQLFSYFLKIAKWLNKFTFTFLILFEK